MKVGCLKDLCDSLSQLVWQDIHDGCHRPEMV